MSRFPMPALAACLAACISSIPAAPSFASGNPPAAATSARPGEAAEIRLGLVVVLPPGTSLGGDANRYLDELAALVAASAGLPGNSVKAVAGNSSDEAAGKVSGMKDCLVLGGLGFYAAHGKALGLSPLMALKRAGTADGGETYRVLAAKGRFKSLADAKGLAMAGTPAFEPAAFLDEALFAGTGLSSGDFKLEATSRPLREIRKLKDGRRDLVVVDEAQFASLAALPDFDALEVVHQSRPVPSLGVMGRGKAVVAPLSQKLKDALKGVCGREDGKALCQGFGIQGFRPVDASGVEAFARSLEK